MKLIILLLLLMHFYQIPPHHKEKCPHFVSETKPIYQSIDEFKSNKLDNVKRVFEEINITGTTTFWQMATATLINGKWYNEIGRKPDLVAIEYNIRFK